MASITVRNLDDRVKKRLHVRAAKNHRTMEEEARPILRDGVNRGLDTRDLAEIARSYFVPNSEGDQELLSRRPGREPPSFD